MTGWSAFGTPVLNTFPTGALALHLALASISNINHIIFSFKIE
jgi:hypothetical protein